MKSCFAYIRPKADEDISDQRRSLQHYATRHSLEIIHWFEERPRSAYGHRPEFRKMLRALTARKASIALTDARERFSRNLMEWAEISELANRGIEFRFAGAAKGRAPMLLDTNLLSLLPTVEAWPGPRVSA